MSRKRSIVIQTLVTAAAAVTLFLGTAQLSAGTASATTIQPTSASAESNAAPGTHWITWSTTIASKEDCDNSGRAMVFSKQALDYICTPTVVKNACSTKWTLDIERPGMDAAAEAKPAAAAC